MRLEEQRKLLMKHKRHYDIISPYLWCMTIQSHIIHIKKSINVGQADPIMQQ